METKRDQLYMTQVLNEQNISLQVLANTKEEALLKLIDLMTERGNIKDKAQFTKDVFYRESQITTGVGRGIAIPHAKSSAVLFPAVCAISLQNPVNYSSLDKKPVSLLFLIAVPENEDQKHLQLLSCLATLLTDAKLADTLMHAQTPQNFMTAIRQAEEKQFAAPKDTDKEKSAALTSVNDRKKYRILAVTGCPVGIAHTYIAAKNLEDAAKETGILIKVETHGASGENGILTADEIADCDAIIVAADISVDLTRFDGKPVVFSSVSKAVYHPKQLLKQALDTNIKKFSINQKMTGVQKEIHTRDLLKKFYQHLMYGISYMIPFVVSGGISLAIHYLLAGSAENISRFMGSIGNLAFSMMFPVTAAYIAKSIAGKSAFTVGFIGGLIMSGTMGEYLNTQNSGLIGALAIGFLSGGIILFFNRILVWIPANLDSIKIVLIYPFFGVLFISLVAYYIINPPLCALNHELISFLSMLDMKSKFGLGALLGAMMSVDFGGPVNKAAYVFGTMSIANGHFGIMASVMAGGMTPPLIMALCTTFMRKSFNEIERKTGILCYFFGASFITEGAISFAAADPFRVIPSCIFGSAVSGFCSALFGCTVTAPHGGLFILPLIGNWQLFLLSLGIGSVSGALLYAALKKYLKKI